ncbi:sulfurtransferase [Robbsia andropogonis]|uniref:Sulfurtransferase n=1 Tax=Robbsia andropogonis TaxID=28092 RepID=A0A0F5K1Y3_9BURK|nr:rhodanese-like domain-containing protein [Robbsia andropogonis]KKB63945.1 sulfurtransferase [Robbsia andropogonis]MCP1116635.1 rhodanese-like domain-containing protein [Robbsia andropogonis]MCP1126686.1 rhodanese-like domain-containing protein [Robbsia andropogonis]
MEQLAPAALAERLADASRPAPVLLDVREPWEIQTVALPNIVAIPMNQIPVRIDELDPEAEIVCICHHGGRSAQVAMFLGSRGFTRLHNLQGGMDAYARTVDPSLPTY